jgi:hypothetical protein
MQRARVEGVNGRRVGAAGRVEPVRLLELAQRARQRRAVRPLGQAEAAPQLPLAIGAGAVDAQLRQPRPAGAIGGEPAPQPVERRIDAKRLVETGAQRRRGGGGVEQRSHPWSFGRKAGIDIA